MSLRDAQRCRLPHPGGPLPAAHRVPRIPAHPPAWPASARWSRPLRRIFNLGLVAAASASLVGGAPVAARGGARRVALCGPGIAKGRSACGRPRRLVASAPQRR